MSASFSIQLDKEVPRSHLNALGIKLTKFFEERVYKESVCKERVYEESVYFKIVYEGAGAESKRTVFYYINQNKALFRGEGSAGWTRPSSLDLK